MAILLATQDSEKSFQRELPSLTVCISHLLMNFTNPPQDILVSLKVPVKVCFLQCTHSTSNQPYTCYDRITVEQRNAKEKAEFTYSPV